MTPGRDAGGDSPVALTALFAAFLKISMCAFGGGLVWARRAVVEQRHWLSDEDFADIVGLCQFMPGPNILGIAVCVGAKLRGGRGALAAVAGFTLLPIVAGFALGTIYLRQARLPLLQNILSGVSAAAAGLLIATGIRLLMLHRTRPAALIFAALAFAGMIFVKLPLFVVLLGLAPLSVALAGLEKARAA
jgi:chromate transporter